MYTEQHIKDCKKLWDAGVTKDWRSCKNWFSEDDVDFLIDYSDGTVYIADDELEYIPVGGDRFTDHLVRWLNNKDYYLFSTGINNWKLREYMHTTQNPLQVFNGYTYIQALVQACVWVLKNEK